METDVCYLTAQELLSAYRHRRLSPIEVTRAVLSRAHDSQDSVNAFAEIADEQALRAAAESESRWTTGEPLGSLDGVPVTLKDVFWVKGWHCRQGSRATDPEFRAPEDSPVTARLRGAGGVILGRTNVPDFCWKPLCDSPLSGTTYNPWRLDRTPGGSTGGGAAAVALGIGPLTIGTDGGGSVRHPASFCGLVGLKPSFGRVPIFPRVGHNDLNHAGPIARSVGDVALCMSVIAGPHSADWFSQGAPLCDDPDDAHVELKGLTIGWSTEFGGTMVDPEVLDAFHRTVRQLVELGGTLVEFPRPPFDMLEIYLTLCRAHTRQEIEDLSEAQRTVVDPKLLDFALAGPPVTFEQYYAALSQRAELGRWFAQQFDKVSFLVTPTMPVTAAFAADRDDDEPNTNNFWSWIPFTFPFNLTKQPAITLNCGYSTDNLPIGFQIVGRAGSDQRLLEVASRIEGKLAQAWPSSRLQEQLGLILPKKAQYFSPIQ